MQRCPTWGVISHLSRTSSGPSSSFLKGSTRGRVLTRRSNYRSSSLYPRFTTSTALQQTDGKRPHSFRRLPGAQGLYHPALEKDSCGVGLIASIEKVPSRDIVHDAAEMLERMSHRGGTGCDPCSGDGAGRDRVKVLRRC